MGDDLEPTTKVSYEVGESLDTKSVGELEENILMLGQEIIRIEQEIEKKRASKNLAQDVFKT